MRHLSVFKFKTEFFGNNLAAGQDSDISEHFFSSVAKSGSLNSNAGKCSAKFIHNDGGECFAFNIFGDYNKFLARLNYLL